MAEIQVTDEMVQAYVTSWKGRLFKPPQDSDRPAVRAGLAAVLAIVERDLQGAHHDRQTERSRLVETIVHLATELAVVRGQAAAFRDKLAALAAIEDYIGESGENAARNIRDLLAGTGDDGNDPRVQARAWGLTW